MGWWENCEKSRLAALSLKGLQRWMNKTAVSCFRWDGVLATCFWLHRVGSSLRCSQALTADSKGRPRVSPVSWVPSYLLCKKRLSVFLWANWFQGISVWISKRWCTIYRRPFPHKQPHGSIWESSPNSCSNGVYMQSALLVMGVWFLHSSDGRFMPEVS